MKKLKNCRIINEDFSYDVKAAQKLFHRLINAYDKKGLTAFEKIWSSLDEMDQTPLGAFGEDIFKIIYSNILEKVKLTRKFEIENQGSK